MSDALISLNVNRTRLNTTMARYARELGLAPKEIVRGQMGIIMRELAAGANPKNRPALDNQINKDISQVYRMIPRKTLPNVHISGSGFVWLMAGQNKKSGGFFVMGVDPSNYRPDDTVENMKKEFYASKKLNPGGAYKELGTRSLKNIWSVKSRKPRNVHVVDANRIMVKRQTYLRFKAWLKTRVGILGASWAAAWDNLGVKGREPAAFKMKHVRDGTHKGAFIDGLGMPGRATFTIINQAVGCEHDNSLKMVSGVLRHRAEAMKVDIKNILSGAYKRAGWSKKT